MSKKGVSKYSEYLSQGMPYDQAMYYYRKDNKICTECGSKLIDAEERLCQKCRLNSRKKANAHFMTGKTHRYKKICKNETCHLENNIFYAHNKRNKFCSKKCMGEWQSRHNRGKNSNSWNPDRTKVTALSATRELVEMDIWKQKIKKRDNYICQFCGYDKGSILESHHIIRLSDIIDELTDYEKELLINKELTINLYNKLFNLDNGICLCKECHKKTYGNNNKYQELFKDIIAGQKSFNIL